MIRQGRRIRPIAAGHTGRPRARRRPAADRAGRRRRHDEGRGPRRRRAGTDHLPVVRRRGRPARRGGRARPRRPRRRQGSTAASGDPVADLRAGSHAHVAFGLDDPALFALLDRADPHGITGRRRRARRAPSPCAPCRGHRSAASPRGAGRGADPRRRRQHRPALLATHLQTATATCRPIPPMFDGDDPAAVVITFRTVVPELPGLTTANDDCSPSGSIGPSTARPGHEPAATALSRAGADSVLQAMGRPIR